MATLEKIPLQTETSDQLVTIELGGNPYILRVLWNERFGYFCFSILESDSTPIIVNIKMVKNYPLLATHKDIRLPIGDFYFIQEKGKAERPGYSDIGVSFGLYYYEPDIQVTAQPERQEVAAPILGTTWDSSLTIWDSGDTLWDQ